MKVLLQKLEYFYIFICVNFTFKNRNKTLQLEEKITRVSQLFFDNFGANHHFYILLY